jgi:hypothetical protein
VPVAKVGRNQPCTCGSGRKAKGCCGVASGPPPDQRARAWLNAEAREWAPLLAGYTDAELHEVVEEIRALPVREASLHVPLPRVLPPALERLRRATEVRDADAAVDALEEALGTVDTPLLREHLARAVLALYEDGRLRDDTTALALIDLAAGHRPALLFAGLVQAIAVAAGTVPRPSGLLIGTR